MWFTPVRDRDQDKLLTRVMNITDVVLTCRDTGYEWFEQLLENVSFYHFQTNLIIKQLAPVRNG